MLPRQKQILGLAVAGEILLIVCFTYFAGYLQTEKLVLNIAFASLVYLLVFQDLFLPWVDMKDKANRQVGSLGLRWVFTFMYQALAIILIVVFLLDDTVPLERQLLFHSILLFLYLASMFMASSAADKVAEIQSAENVDRNGMERMRDTVKDALTKAQSLKEGQSLYKTRLERLLEDIRYLSPGKSPSATSLEQAFLSHMRKIAILLGEQPLQEQELEQLLNASEATLKERKQTYAH